MQDNVIASDALKALVQKRSPLLVQAIRQLAQAVGNRPPEPEEIDSFFHDFMDGYWDAFAEATAHNTTKLKQADVQSQELQKQILQQLDPAHRELFGEYEALLYSRMTSELDQAYLTGYQTAIRFLLIGILPTNTMLAHYSRNISERGDEKNET